MERWLKQKKIDNLIVRTYGATVFPPDDADMIVDNTATGRTLIEMICALLMFLRQAQLECLLPKSAMKTLPKNKK